MTYQQLCSKAFTDCQSIYNETTSFGSPSHIIEEIHDIVDFYIDRYPELIADEEQFRSRICSAFNVLEYT